MLMVMPVTSSETVLKSLSNSCPWFGQKTTKSRGGLDSLYKMALAKADGHVKGDGHGHQAKATKLDFNAIAWLLLGQ